MPRDTSIDAYHDLEAAGVLGGQQRRIMLFLHTYPQQSFTRAELAKLMGMRLSSICGRVNELIELGYLEDGDKRKCRESGRTCHVIRVRQMQLSFSLEAA